jgi:hypothetical protein
LDKDNEVTGTNGKKYSYGGDSQKPHPYDYKGLSPTGFDAGIMMTKSTVFFYTGLSSSMYQYDFDVLNRFINK